MSSRSLSLTAKICVLLVLPVLALVAFMTMVSSNSGTTSVSALGPTPTTEPNPGTDGFLSGVYDLEVVPGLALYNCILRNDHDAGTNRVKIAAVCYADFEAGDPANVLSGVYVPGEGPTAGAGPPPPPPYAIAAPSLGAGEYFPGGNADCSNVGTGSCLVTITCFPDIGAGSLGPNMLAKVILPDPDVTPDTQLGTITLVGGVSVKACDSLDPTVFAGGTPLAVGLFDPAGSSPTAWRTAAGSATDFDGDGCTDADELDTKGARPKGCGDDPYNPLDSNKTDFSGAYEILIRVLRAEETPGFGGIYFNCLADIQQTGTGKTDGDLVTRAFCYTDGFNLVVNALGYPGVTGDGFPGGSPPYGAIPANGAPETNCARGLAGVSLDEDADTVPNDGCPSEGLGDIDSKHMDLYGFVDNATNTLKLRGCFEDEDNSEALGNMYVEISVNRNTGVGAVDIWTNQVAATCNGTYAFGAYGADTGQGEPAGAFNDAEISIVRQPGGQNRDTDQDGVPDAIELVDAGNQNTCGGRDPFNPWDHYDVNQDGVIDVLNDIMGVISRYQPQPGGAPPYDVLYDRPPAMTGAVGHWNRGAPDGVIDLPNDIRGVVLQYHPGTCGLGGKAPFPPGSPTNTAMSISVDGAHTTSCPGTKVNGETCVGFNNSFDVIVSADTIPAAGYLLAQAWVDFDNQGLTWSANNTSWPDCDPNWDFGGLKGNAAMQGCLTGMFSSPISFYTGELFRISLTCTSTASESVLRLIPSNTPPAGTSGALFTNAFDLQEIPSVGGDLLVNCVGATTITPTFTPTNTPTPTPTFIPAQGKIFPVAGGSIGDTLPAVAAALSSPADVAVVEPGGPQIDVYIADRDHCRIRLVVPGGTTTTIAGTGECGYGGDGGPAVDAKLNHPTGVDVDASGNIYIADEGNCRVRVIDTSGTITTFAGNGTCGNGADGGSATGTQLNGPYDVLVDGSDLLIVDRDNCRVRVVSGGNITHLAGDPSGVCGPAVDGGSAATAKLNDPRRLALDAGGNLHIADGGNCRVRKVDSVTGIITTVAGSATCGFSGDTGDATLAQLNEPDGLAFDSAGNLYIADLGNCRVRMVNTGGTIDTVAGNDPGGGPCGYGGDGGDATSAQLNAPSGMDFDSSQRLYIADRDNHRIRRVGSPITTIAGTGLPDFCGDTFVAIDESCLDGPHDVAIDNAGNVYIADAGNHRIRKIDAGTGSIDTLAGKNEQTNCPDTSGTDALTLCLDLPRHIAVSPDNNLLYISDEGRNQIWLVNIGSGAFSRVAGAANGAAGGPCLVDTLFSVACLNQPRGLALQQVGGIDKYLFVAQGGNSGSVLRVDRSNNTVRTVFQDTGNELSSDVALGPGNSLYIAQAAANRVRWVDTGADSEVDGTDDLPVTVAGSGTPGLTTDGTVATSAKLDGPGGVAMSQDDELLISDRNNHRLWVVRTGDSTPNVVDGEPSERIYRIAGGGTPTPGFCGDPKAKPNPTPSNAHNARDACLDSPADLSYDYINSALYFADELNQRVRKVPSDCDDDGLADAVELAGLASTEPGLGPFFTEKCTTDTDGDGCSDAEEVGSNEAGGGRRDPTNPWDFYDVGGLAGGPDGVIDLLFDILGVIQHYSPSGSPPYDVAFDRGPSAGPNAWNMTAPDGVIDLLNDILGVILQHSHDCR